MSNANETTLLTVAERTEILLKALEDMTTAVYNLHLRIEKLEASATCE